MSPLPPGPRDSLLGLRLAGRLRRNPLRFLSNLGRDYGDLAIFRLGPYRACLVNHPDLIREVLVTQRSAFPKLDRHCRTIRGFSGNSVFVSDGELWLRQRRLIQPAFQARLFNGYSDAAAGHTQKLLQEWKNGDELDLAPPMARLSLLSISQSLFDYDLSGQSDLLLRALQIHSETLRDEFRAPLVLPDWLPLAAKRRKRWAIGVLRDWVRSRLVERRGTESRRSDVLSMLLSAMDEGQDGQRISEQQAIDEATILFVAGQDDITAALTWCWYLLAQHPDVESRFRQELGNALSGRSPSYADIERLPLTEMIVKETLRLYPPTWSLVPRRANREVTLGGCRIPRGAWIFISPYVTHRDRRFFPDPNRFDPERFSAQRQPEISQFAYIPFGGGPRICIGNHFSIALLTTMLAVIGQRFRLSLCDDPGKIVPDPGLALRPRGGLRVRLQSIL